MNEIPIVESANQQNLLLIDEMPKDQQAVQDMQLETELTVQDLSNSIQTEENKELNPQQKFNQPKKSLSKFKSSLGKFSIHKETPISKNFRNTIKQANELTSNLQSSMQAFQMRLSFVKQKLFQRSEEDKENRQVVNEQPKAPGIMKKSIKKSPKQQNMIFPGAFINTPLISSSTPKRQSMQLESEGNNNTTSNSGIIDQKTEFNQKFQNEFGHQELRSYQVAALEDIMNKKNVVLHGQSCSGKSVVYMLASYYIEGIVIVIGSSQYQLTQKLESIPSSIQSGILYPQISNEDKMNIVEMIRKGQIKLLLINGERNFIESIFNELRDIQIGLLVIDDMQVILDKLKSFINKDIKIKYKVSSLLSITRYTQIYQSLCNINTSTNSNNIIMAGGVIVKRANINITQDIDKQRGLLALMRCPQYKNQSYIILFCDGKKQHEDAINILNTNGIKAVAYQNGKNDILTIKSGVTTVIVAFYSQALLMDRTFITSTIHYTLPSNIEEYLYSIFPPGIQLGGLDKQYMDHTFLNDEDFIRLRNSICGEFVDKIKILRLLDKILTHSKIPQRHINKNYNTKIESLNTNINNISNINKQKAIQKFTNINVQQVLVNEDNKSETTNENDQYIDEEDYLILKINDLCVDIDLRKEVIHDILQRIEQIDKSFLKLLPNIPIVASVKFKKDKPEALIQKYPFIKHIIDSQKKPNGMYRCSLEEISNKIKQSPHQIYKQLKALQQDNQLTFEILEEAFRIKTLYTPNQVMITNIIESVFIDQYEKDSGKLQKLDFVYVFFKLSNLSHPSMDHFLTKKRNENLKNELRKGPSQKNMESNNKKKNELDFYETIEKYFQCEKSIDNLLQELGIHEFRDYLPLSSISTQRDKSGIHGDLNNLFLEKFDQLMPNSLSDNLKIGDWMQIMKITSARNLIRVLQGIPSNKFLANEWKACKYWDKYYKIDYRELLELAMDVVQNNLDENLKLKKNGRK